MRALLVLALFGACVAAAQAQSCTELPQWAQCGGRSNCNGSPEECAQPWKDKCCPSGYVCTKNSDWYYNCQPTSGNGGHNGGNNGGGGGGGGNNPAPAPPSGPGAYKPEPPVPARKIGSDWDWAQPLGLSFLFYEAQRSGKLPANNRISWRGDSGLEHKTSDGRDVTGGWYDAGDNVKFNLPMAWASHVLAWSVVDFADGYYKAEQLGTALSNVKWVTDYFIKCIGKGDRDIVVQVGSGSQDHGVWGRPEDIKSAVPVYTVNPSSPGSDVVGAMGATLGAAAVAFQRADEAYSKELLSAAIKAYEFASKHIGKYSDSVSDAGAFYRSSNVHDDIALNAIWLYIATGQESYKKAAYEAYMKHYKDEDGPGVWDNFDWDSNSWAAVVLLQRYFPEDPILKLRVTKFVRAWTAAESDIVKFTPKGLAYSGPWGSLRHVGNAMFLMKAWAVGSPNADPAIKQTIDCTVRKQLGYILGDTGRSFVVGYGTNPPARPHHRASSCPPLGVACTWDYFNNPGPNPHTLYGALVGGPGASDDYNDDRNDYIKNEVATDYNAGFTGALAGAARGLLPCQPNAAANAPIFETTVGKLPKLAIQLLPAPYIKSAMKVVNGQAVDVVDLPKLPAAEVPVPAPAPVIAPVAVPAPAPVVPQPVATPAPAPAATPAPGKALRPPQNLCFTWNDRTRQYEATTVEAREFLASLLGIKESSKTLAPVSLQGAIEIAARRLVRGPNALAAQPLLPAPATPGAKEGEQQPAKSAECVCAACPAVAPCPAAPQPSLLKEDKPAPSKPAAADKVAEKKEEAEEEAEEKDTLGMDDVPAEQAKPVQKPAEAPLKKAEDKPAAAAPVEKKEQQTQPEPVAKAAEPGLPVKAEEPAAKEQQPAGEADPAHKKKKKKRVKKVDGAADNKEVVAAQPEKKNQPPAPAAAPVPAAPAPQQQPDILRRGGGGGKDGDDKTPEAPEAPEAPETAPVPDKPKKNKWPIMPEVPLANQALGAANSTNTAPTTQPAPAASQQTNSNNSSSSDSFGSRGTQADALEGVLRNGAQPAPAAGNAAGGVNGTATDPEKKAKKKNKKNKKKKLDAAQGGDQQQQQPAASNGSSSNGAQAATPAVSTPAPAGAPTPQQPSSAPVQKQPEQQQQQQQQQQSSPQAPAAAPAAAPAPGPWWAEKHHLAAMQGLVSEDPPEEADAAEQPHRPSKRQHAGGGVSNPFARPGVTWQLPAHMRPQTQPDSDADTTAPDAAEEPPTQKKRKRSSRKQLDADKDDAAAGSP